MILSNAQRELLTKSPHLVPVADDLGDGDVLALHITIDITTGDKTYIPYVLTINGDVQEFMPQEKTTNDKRRKLQMTNPTVLNNKMTWIGINGAKHAFVHGRHGISRICACGEYPHPDLAALNLNRDDREGLPQCGACIAEMNPEPEPEPEELPGWCGRCDTPHSGECPDYL